MLAWVSRLWYLPVGYLFPNRVMIVSYFSIAMQALLISNSMGIYRDAQAIALSHPF